MAEKVLLIDDEKYFVETLSERMRSRGMDVPPPHPPKKDLRKQNMNITMPLFLI